VFSASFWYFLNCTSFEWTLYDQQLSFVSYSCVGPAAAGLASDANVFYHLPKKRHPDELAGGLECFCGHTVRVSCSNRLNSVRSPGLFVPFRIINGRPATFCDPPLDAVVIYLAP
jgi:hypothetical protein